MKKPLLPGTVFTQELEPDSEDDIDSDEEDIDPQVAEKQSGMMARSEMFLRATQDSNLNLIQDVRQQQQQQQQQKQHEQQQLSYDHSPSKPRFDLNV